MGLDVAMPRRKHSDVESRWKCAQTDFRIRNRFNPTRVPVAPGEIVQLGLMTTVADCTLWPAKSTPDGFVPDFEQAPTKCSRFWKYKVLSINRMMRRVLLLCFANGHSLCGWFSWDSIRKIS